ncbi:hypothetical protein ACHAXR_008701 [Thalassiosira sp. AJA248-18]
MMSEGNNESYAYGIITSNVAPDIMKLKPGEAPFNIEKYPDAVECLLSNGIICSPGFAIAPVLATVPAKLFE